MLISSFCLCLGQLFWKIIADGYLLYLTLGFICYGIGGIMLIIALKYDSVSILMPMNSFCYVIALLVGNFLFNEQILMTKIIGIIFIILGILVIARDTSDNNN